MKLILLGLLGSISANAGISMTYQAMSRDRTTMKIFMEKGNLRNDVIEAGKTNISFFHKSGAEEMWTLDHTEKSATKMGKKSIADLQDRMKQMMKQVPEAQRKMMESMMAKSAPPSGKKSWKKLGAKTTNQGAKCDHYGVYAGATLTGEACIVIGNNAVSAAEWKKGLAAYNQLAEFGGPNTQGPSLPDSLATAPGVGTWFQSAGHDKTKMVLTEISVASPPSKAFEVPAGYKVIKIDIPH